MLSDSLILLKNKKNLGIIKNKLAKNKNMWYNTLCC